MQMFRQLIADAQAVLRDMSATQRVAVTSFILTVAGLLTLAAYLGTRGEAAHDLPIPVKVQPTDYPAVAEALRKKGFKAEYNADMQMFMINAADQEKAYLYLVSEKVVNAGNVDRASLDQMVERISFTDTNSALRLKERQARANSVGLLIARLDGITEAEVIFSDDKRMGMFLGTAPLSASVLVRTRFGRPLDDAMAQTIIDLVACAKADLKPQNVRVTDQTGQRRFSYNDDNSPLAMVKNGLEHERQRDAIVYTRIEDLLRVRIPNLANGGAVTIVPVHRVRADRVQIGEQEYYEGTAVEKESFTQKTRSTQGPPYEPGVQPNVGTSARVDAENNGAGAGGARKESSNDIKRQTTRNQPSRRDTVTDKAQAVEDVTLSVIIQLPYELELDENGKTIPATDEYGDPIINPETRKPELRKKSIAKLTDEEMRVLRNICGNAAGIKPDAVAEKVLIDQVEWRPPVYSSPTAESTVTALVRMLRKNGFAIVAAFMLVALSLVFVWQARQQVSVTLEDDELEEDEVAESIGADVPVEDPAHIEMEATRMRVREAVMEDPKRAAALVKRWINKDA